MLDIVFPQKTNQRYWILHFEYVLNIFKYLNCNITYAIKPQFTVTINGKEFLMDYWDTSEVQGSDLPSFKFHCIQETDKIFGFPPISFYDWGMYNNLSATVHYSAKNSTLISNRQRPYGNAIERRTKVQKMLKDVFGSLLVTNLIQEEDYLKDVAHIGLAVFVPGQNNNMIDRAHLKYLALGCCTVSPRLPEILPFGQTIIPNVHYVQCKDDYSDLIETISQCQSNTDFCDEIGSNAKNLFKETCTPEAIGKWIGQHL